MRAAPQLREEEGGGRNGSILACDMVYALEGPMIREDGYLYSAAKVNGTLIADAYIHDESVLPHQVPGDPDVFFPKARAAEPYPEEEEIPDAM